MPTLKEAMNDPDAIKRALEAAHRDQQAMKATPTNKDILREKIIDWRIDQHICDDEGYGCEYESFVAHGMNHTRCKLLRESDDKLLQLIADDKRAIPTPTNKDEELTLREKLDSVANEYWNVHEHECPKYISRGADDCDCNMIRLIDDIEEAILTQEEGSDE